MQESVFPSTIGSQGPNSVVRQIGFFYHKSKNIIPIIVDPRQKDWYEFEISLSYSKPCHTQKKKNEKGVGEMAQWFRAISALPEDLNLVPAPT